MMKTQTMKGTVNSVRVFLTGLIVTMLFSFSCGMFVPGTALTVQAAGDSGTDQVILTSYDTEWLGEDGNKTFDDVTAKVKDTGNSMYRLMMAIGVVGLVLSIISGGLMIALTQNANKRSEHIGHFVWIVIGGVAIFGAITLIGIIKDIGVNLG